MSFACIPEARLGLYPVAMAKKELNLPICTTYTECMYDRYVQNTTYLYVPVDKIEYRGVCQRMGVFQVESVAWKFV
jgi:hypothetical protein